jgi:pantoate--beta-alanine ligase
MEITRNIADTRTLIGDVRRGGQRVGFVPTMGALHRGHATLIEAARRDGTYTVVSIFVNPTQFGPNEDYQKYPRDEETDLRLCQQAEVDLVFIPSPDEMYHTDAVTRVHVAKLTETLCGVSRPGHFDGVTTVCTKLFNIVQPDVAYFGEKDFQQLAVMRQMVRDLDMPLEIVGCPTVREENGLALSSRNAYLSPAEREQAASLYRGLLQARNRINAGERNASKVTALVRDAITNAGPARIDYIRLVDPNTMQPVERIGGQVLVALAVYIGAARLIDNILVDPARRGG